MIQSDSMGNAHGGAAILTRNKIPTIHITLQTTLQAVAVRIFTDRLLTVCCLYLPPNEPVSRRQMDILIGQLPEPFLLMGDLNARHRMWGDTTENEKGKMIFDLISETSIDLLNDGKPTHFHFQTNTLSRIDLSLCSPGCIGDLQWEISCDLYNSDHFPIKVTLNTELPFLDHQRFIYEKADWSCFNHFAATTEDPMTIDTIDNAVQHLTSIISEAAARSIPMTKGGLHKKCVPWWNPEVARAWKRKKLQLRNYQRSRLICDKIEFMKARAELRNLIRSSRKESWEKYTQSINSHTPINKVWKRIHKINGKYTQHPTPILYDTNNSLIADPTAVGEIFGQTLSTISRGSSSPLFLREKEKCSDIRFGEDGGEEYNHPIKEEEVNAALAASKNTAAGEDKIHYQMLKHLPNVTLRYIVDLFNRIWTSKQFPSCWRTSIVLPFPKANKDHRNPKNYRPITLTSCLCKLMERIVNVRLTWTLESGGRISEKQYGFRQGRSTTDALIYLDTFIKTAFSKKNIMYMQYSLI